MNNTLEKIKTSKVRRYMLAITRKTTLRRHPDFGRVKFYDDGKADFSSWEASLTISDYTPDDGHNHTSLISNINPHPIWLKIKEYIETNERIDLKWIMKNIYNPNQRINSVLLEMEESGDSTRLAGIFNVRVYSAHLDRNVIHPAPLEKDLVSSIMNESKLFSETHPGVILSGLEYQKYVEKIMEAEE